MMIKNIANTLRFMRNFDVRMMAQDYADDVLGRYGYVRPPSTALRVLSMAGAFGAGVAIGTGVGMLFAPSSGVETRQKISRQVEGAVSRVKQTVTKRTTNGKSTIVTDDPAIRHS